MTVDYHTVLYQSVVFIPGLRAAAVLFKGGMEICTFFLTEGLKGLRDHRRKRGPFQKQECVSNTLRAFAVFALVTYAFLFIFLHAVSD